MMGRIHGKSSFTNFYPVFFSSSVHNCGGGDRKIQNFDSVLYFIPFNCFKKKNLADDFLMLVMKL